MNKLRKLFGYRDKDIDSIIVITDTRAYIAKKDFFNLKSVKETIEKFNNSDLIKEIDTRNHEEPVEAND